MTELATRKNIAKLKQKQNVDPALLETLQSYAESIESQPDYLKVVNCLNCSWSGPAYLMLPPTRFPGTIRCPLCKSNNPVVEVVETTTGDLSASSISTLTEEQGA